MAYCESFMKEALRLAASASCDKEVPVGAVIVKNNRVIATGTNLREKTKSSLAHAEIVAIHRACLFLGDWRLNGCDIYVTLEPCPMCAGAILLSRIKTLYFGAYDRENGAFCQGMLPILHKKTDVYGGIYEKESAAILAEFFQKKRSFEIEKEDDS